MKQSKVFAHRGASQYAPENTLEAFRLAMEQGAEGIELDVHLSADGELVVIHDETLERTTNGTGLVKEHTLAQLQALRADNHMEGFEAAHIPTLRQVLELVRPGDMQVNIELKTGILWYEGIEEKTLELVKELGMQDRVVYSSFNHYSIEEVRRLDPTAETAYLFSDVHCINSSPRRGNCVKTLGFYSTTKRARCGKIFLRAARTRVLTKARAGALIGSGKRGSPDDGLRGSAKLRPLNLTRVMPP